MGDRSETAPTLVYHKLEIELQCELNLSRVIRAVNGACDLPERGSSRKRRTRGSREIWVVGDVKELGAKFQGL